MAEEKNKAVKLLTIYQYSDTSRIRVEPVPTFEDPFSWGIVLVDAIRILAEAYAADEGATDSQPYLDRIKQGLDAEYAEYTSPIEFGGPALKDDNDG